MEIAAQAAAEDPRFRIMQQKERLRFMNFAAVLDAARTPYFCWLAGDDYWHPSFLAKAHTALSGDPNAVSALPSTLFEVDGELTGVRPDNTDLTGDWAKRVRDFLVNPGGTRMYGLFRTDPLKASFPTREMVAYDWALMIAVLRQGDQIALDQTLLFRDRTDWRAYPRQVDKLYSSRFFRNLPLADMTIYLLRKRLIPLSFSVVARLLHLNVLKHEEYVFVTQPEKWLKRRRIYRRLGMPFARNPASTREALAQLPDGPETKDALSEDVSLSGQAEEKFAYAIYLLNQNSPSEAERSTARRLLREASASEPAAALRLLQVDEEEGRIEPAELASRYLRLAEKGSHQAAGEAGRLSVSGLGGPVDKKHLAFVLETARDTGHVTAVRPLAWLLAHGIGTNKDLDRAFALYDEILDANPAAHRDYARVLIANERASEKVIHHFTSAIEGGLHWCVIDLIEFTQGIDPRQTAFALYWSLRTAHLAKDPALLHRLQSFWDQLGAETFAEMRALNLPNMEDLIAALGLQDRLPSNRQPAQQISSMSDG